ncbi:tetratricopeptide repeat protein [Roseicyclus persicicus]|uniref:Tetratricopeptide repeat protein n=1 Tax=Roseicyclus persicicus TaxID=2650661 RepID=A0A7X6H1J9_9RHOB|nr:hypothetical protein [Roseibacterium persicicum]NKX46341.1 hypothetical protein [Roseibacterium persicicum]
MAFALSRVLPTCTALAVAATLALAGPAAAQAPALESQRQAVFAQLLAAPADRALMLQYARLSVQLRDFEAAAATLERFVDLEPRNVGARIELAIAYFALGAYDVAAYHLAAAEASGALTPEQAAQVARYRDETAERDAPQQLQGFVALGRGWTREADLQGGFGSAALEWRIDLGDRHATQWVTALSYAAYLPGEQTFSQREVTRLRSGPEFRLAGDAYGPRLQPYVELTWLREDSVFFTDGYDSVAIGLAYQNPIDARWTVYADLQAGEADPVNSFSQGFRFHDARLGAGYRPSRDTRIRATLGWRQEDFDFGLVETTHSLRIEAQHSFDIGGGALRGALPRNWEVGAFVQRAVVEEDFGFFTSETTDTLYGGALRAYVTEAVFLDLRGGRMERDFGFGFVQTETFYGVQIGWEF